MSLLSPLNHSTWCHVHFSFDRVPYQQHPFRCFFLTNNSPLKELKYCHTYQNLTGYTVLTQTIHNITYSQVCKLYASFLSNILIGNCKLNYSIMEICQSYLRLWVIQSRHTNSLHQQCRTIIKVEVAPMSKHWRYTSLLSILKNSENHLSSATNLLWLMSNC